MRAAQVELEAIDAGCLYLAYDLLPRLLAVLLHDRGDQHLVGIVLLELTQIVEPVAVGAIADQLDVLKADHFLTRAATQLRVTRSGVDHLARVERERLAHHAAPTEVVAACDHLAVRSRRSRAEQERIVELHAIDSDRQI